MASKRDLLMPFIERACLKVINEKLAGMVRRDREGIAIIVCREIDTLPSEIALEICRTYSLLELEDIINWRKRKTLDFERERTD